jgi:hypothetical protein
MVIMEKISHHNVARGLLISLIVVALFVVVICLVVFKTVRNAGGPSVVGQSQM